MYVSSHTRLEVDRESLLLQPHRGMGPSAFLNFHFPSPMHNVSLLIPILKTHVEPEKVRFLLVSSHFLFMCLLQRKKDRLDLPEYECGGSENKKCGG